MEKSESIKELMGALTIFHEEVNNIPKTATNPFFKSKYVPLDKILTAIREPLKKAGLAFMQFPKDENELETIIIHSSGEWVSGSYRMKAEKQTPQGYGSVITYQRRYALSAILGLNTDDDDDANAAEIVNPVNYREKAISDMNAVTSRDGMVKVWKANPKLKNDAEFLAVTKAIGDKYPAPPPPKPTPKEESDKVEEPKS